MASGSSGMPNQAIASVLGTPVQRVGAADAIRAIGSGALRSKQVTFFNVHLAIEAVHRDDLRAALCDAGTYNVADGVPIRWLARSMGAEIPSRVCGPDVMPEVLRATRGAWHVLVGGAPGGEAEFAAHFKSLFGLERVVAVAPPFRPFTIANVHEDWARVQVALRAAGCTSGDPDFVWVGLGAPKQELWCHAARLAGGEGASSRATFLAVGAAFDFLGGVKRRAPVWMQRLGLEWLFRLASEPRRLFGRYLRTNTEFLWRWLRQWLSHRGLKPGPRGGSPA